jgi:hypothetical protein
VKRIIQLVKTEFGLVVLLVIYAFLGATAFYYTEHEHDERLKQELIDYRRTQAERIWNVTLQLQYQDHHHHHHRHHHHLDQHGHHQQHQHQHIVVVDYETSNSTTTVTTMPLTSSAALTNVSVNYSAIEDLLDEFAFQKDRIRPNSKAPGWNFWGSLFYCGTIFTTIGWCCVSLSIVRVLCCNTSYCHAISCDRDSLLHA